MTAWGNGDPELRHVECYPLSDTLDDDARTVAAFASTLFARHLVCHFAGSRAFGTEVLGGTWRSGFRIIIRGVRPKWI
jgi:hypothetical protein